MEAKEKNDYGLFAHLSEGYFCKLRELNDEIREYLQAHPDAPELSLPEPAIATRDEAA
jgi:hypothetical protein